MLSLVIHAQYEGNNITEKKMNVNLIVYIYNFLITNYNVIKSN